METVDPAEFRRLLDESPGEREVAAYLRDHPWIVFWTLCATGGHVKYVLSEFRLGTQYVADLVVLHAFSSTWKTFLVELEPADDPVFNKDGTPGRRLTIATRQVDDWRGLIEQNQDSVRRDLVRCAKQRDLLGCSPRSEPCNYTGNYLADPRTHIYFQYKIVIGRSSKLAPDICALMGRYRPNHNVELVSYDRLLGLAERRYGGAGGQAIVSANAV